MPVEYDLWASIRTGNDPVLERVVTGYAEIAATLARLRIDVDGTLWNRLMTYGNGMRKGIPEAVDATSVIAYYDRAIAAVRDKLPFLEKVRQMVPPVLPNGLGVTAEWHNYEPDCVLLASALRAPRQARYSYPVIMTSNGVQPDMVGIGTCDGFHYSVDVVVPWEHDAVWDALVEVGFK